MAEPLHEAGGRRRPRLEDESPSTTTEIIQFRHLTNEVFRDAIERGVAAGAFAPAHANRLVRGMLSLSIDLVRWYGPDSLSN